MTLFFLVTSRGTFRINWRHLPYFAVTGIVSVSLFTLMLFSCQQQCPLAVATILIYTAPAFVLIMSAIIWKEPVTRQKLTALAASFLGCVFISGVFSEDLYATPIGILFGLGGGFFYATYSIIARYPLVHYKPMTVTYYTFVFAAAGSLLVTEPIHIMVAVVSEPHMLLMTLALVTISTVIPFILYTKGLRELGSSKASILATVEPMVAALVGVLAFGEPMTISVIIGLGCIVMSVFVMSK